MGYFPYKESNLPTRIVNALSPQGSYAMYENQLFTDSEESYYRDVALELEAPSDGLISLAYELTDPFTIQGGSQGQKFGALWLNRHANGDNLLIVENGFLADTTSLDDQMRSFFIARAFPDYQVLVIDQPSHGLSDNYTPEQRKDMFSGSADLSKVGIAQLQAVEDFLERKVGTPRTVDLRAASYGARQSLDLVEASTDSDLAINKLLLLELPGTVNRRVGIHAAFFGYEYLKSGQYNAPWLPDVKKAFRDFLYIYGQPVEQAPGFFTKDKKTAALNFWNSVLGSDTGLRVLGRVIDSGVSVVRVSGEASRIDNPVRATSQWHQLGKRYGQVIAQHASHDALGHLSRARASANMSRVLLDHFPDYLYSPEPRLVSLKDFQN